MLSIGVHAQSGFWRKNKWNPATGTWDKGPWLPNLGAKFEKEGPKERVTDEPATPPSPGDREANDGGWRRY
jgi:hypothetical protein